MQIVIDIPEKTYEQLKFLNKQGFGTVIDEAVANGTPLPKGHGDLIDRNELLRQPMDLANYPSNYVHIAPTVIEADKESEDEDSN